MKKLVYCFPHSRGRRREFITKAKTEWSIHTLPNRRLIVYQIKRNDAAAYRVLLPAVKVALSVLLLAVMVALSCYGGVQCIAPSCHGGVQCIAPS